MSTPEKDTVENVEKLLTERRKVSGWLSALAERKADTSPVVYQRVHDDYRAKLEKVQAKLVAASDAVQVAAADLAGRLTDKEEAVAAKRDERAEAELRALVGEYSEREWDKRRARLDEELAAATAERDTLRDELARLRTVLADVSDTPGETVVPAEEPAVPAAEPESGSGDSPTVDAATPTGDELSTVAASDQLQRTAAAEEFPDSPLVSIASLAEDVATEAAAGDVSVVSSEMAVEGALAAESMTAEAMTTEAGTAETEPEAASATPSAGVTDDDVAPEPSSAPTPVVPTQAVVATAPIIPIHEQLIVAPVEPSAPLAPTFDELAFLKSVVGRPTPVANAPFSEPFTNPKSASGGRETRDDGNAASARDSRSYAMPEPPIAFPDPVPEPRVSQEMTPPRESFFGRPTPRTSEAVKSLRCQECGTLNFPTEWYCERCGGELAAL